jgi:hypothetical protein
MVIRNINHYTMQIDRQKQNNEITPCFQYVWQQQSLPSKYIFDSPQSLKFCVMNKPLNSLWRFALLSLYNSLRWAGIAQWYSAELRSGWSVVRVPGGVWNFSHHRVQTGSGVHPASYPKGSRGSFPKSKATGGEANHSSPPNAEAKNAWSFTSTPPICLHGVVLG